MAKTNPNISSCFKKKESTTGLYQNDFVCKWDHPKGMPHILLHWGQMTKVMHLHKSKYDCIISSIWSRNGVNLLVGINNNELYILSNTLLENLSIHLWCWVQGVPLPQFLAYIRAMENFCINRRPPTCWLCCIVIGWIYKKLVLQKAGS